MASPTTNKGYTYPAHNGSINTWDTPIDADFDQIDLNFGGTYNVTGSSSVATVTFNASQCIAASTAHLVSFPTSIAQNLYYLVNGTFNSSCVLVYPSVGSFYVVNNQVSNGTIYAGITGNTANGVVISSNSPTLVVADSSNMFNTDPVAAATFVSGTQLVFAQAAAPSGWTQSVAQTDRVLRLVNDGTGGNTGGQWSITGLSVGNHTLTSGEMPSHNHSVVQSNSDNSAYQNGGKNANDGTFNTNTGNTGGGGGHNHSVSQDGSWRPNYYNVIICSKN